MTDKHLIFDAVFVLHILQKCLIVLGSIRSLILRIDSHSLVPFPKRLQLRKRIKNMCWNKKRTRRWSDFSKVFGQLCRANFTAKYKSSFLWVFFLAGARKTPSKWSNMSLKMVVTCCSATVCLFDIHRVQYRNGINISMMYMTIVHASSVV